jgi:hypothetical protein
MRVSLALAVLVGLAAASSVPRPALAWQLVHAGESLRVEQREYPGSPLLEVRGVLRLRTTLNAVMALLRDADFNDHWVYRSGGARILLQEGYARAYVYGVVDAPWPMQDRDTVVRFDYQQDPVTRVVLITISNAPDYLPAVDGLVRVPEFGGFWQLEPEAAGWVRVTYQVRGHPGGMIPVWLANRAAARSVQQTLRNMPGAVRRYAGARSPHVLEALADPAVKRRPIDQP